MIERRGDADRAAWTLVLVAAALLALDFSLGLVSPRPRPATGPQGTNDIGVEHEPRPSPLVALRSHHARGAKHYGFTTSFLDYAFRTVWDDYARVHASAAAGVSGPR